MADPVPNPSLAPPQGYRSRDNLTGLVFTGSTWDEVARKIAEYRKVNKVDPGNPLREVHDRFCREYPSHCFNSKPPQFNVSVTPQEPLGQRVTKWLTGVVMTHKAGVLRDEALRRTEICKKCPAQANWWSTCGGCNNNASLLRTEIFRRIGMRQIDTLTESQLQGCQNFGIDTAVAVWLRDIQARPQAPGYCWLKNP